MFNLGTAVGQLVLDARGVQQGVNQATRSLNQLDSATRKNQYGVIQASRAYTALGAAIAAAFAIGIKSAIEWEDALAGVRRTTEATDAQLGRISKGLREIAATKPIQPIGLAQIAEEAGALGVALPDIVEFTSVVADMTAATELSADEASSGLARLTGIMGNTVSEFENVGSAILDLGRSTKATDAEILNMSRRIAGAGKVVGLTTDQVLAYAAATASVGVREEQGGSGLTRTFIDIQRAVQLGSKELQLFAEVAGMTADEYSRAFQDDAGAATMEFIEGIGRLGERSTLVLDQLGISELRQVDVVRRLAAATQNYSDANASLRNVLIIGNKAMADGTVLAQVAEARYNTTAKQLEILRNMVSGAADTFLTRFLPALKSVIGFLQGMMTAFTNLRPQVQSFIMVAAALAGILSALVPIILSIAVAAHQFGNVLVHAGVKGTFFGNAMRFAARSAVGLIALLGAGAIAMGIWGDTTVEQAEAVIPVVEANQELIAAMGRGTAAVRDFTQAMAAPVLDKHSATVKRLGIDYDHVIAAIQGAATSAEFFSELARVNPNDAGIQAFVDDLANLRREYQRSAEEHSALQIGQQEYIDAVEDTTDALKDLRKAEQAAWDAANQRNEAILNLIDAQFAQRSATLSLAREQKNYEEAIKDAAKHPEKIAEAERDLADARLGLADAQRDLADAERGLATARQDALEELADAEDDLADSHDSRADALDNIYDLERRIKKLRSQDGLRAIADATRDLVRAQQNLHKSNRDVSDSEFYLQYLRERGASARDIADAEFALEQSRLAAKDAQVAVTDSEEELRWQREGGGAARELARLERDLAGARRDADSALRDIVENERELNSIRADVLADTAYTDALRDVEDAQRDIARAERDIISAEQDLQEIREYDTALDLAEAQHSLEQAYYNLAQANVEVQKQTALMNGQNWDAGNSARALAAELIALSSALDGPISRNLGSAANKLNTARPLGARPETPTSEELEAPSLDLSDSFMDDIGADLGSGMQTALDNFSSEFGGVLNESMMNIDWGQMLKPALALMAGQMIFSLLKRILPIIATSLVIPMVKAIFGAIVVAVGGSTLAAVAAVAIIAVLIAGIIAWLWKSGIGEKIIGGIYDLIKGAADLLYDFGGWLFDQLMKFIEDPELWLMEVGLNIIEGLANGITGAWDFLWKKVSGFFLDLISKVKGIFGIRSPSTVFSDIGKDLIQGLWDGIEWLWTTFWTFWSSLPGKIISTYADAGRWLFEAGKKVIQGLWNGIKNLWEGATGVASWLGGIGSKIIGFFSNAKNWLFDAGGNIMEGLKNGLLGGVSSVANAIRRPLNWAIDNVINKFVGGVQDFANKIPGIDISLGDIPTLPLFQFHEGGLVGRGGKKRNLGRKRLKREEELAVLLQGERVLNRRETREYEKLKDAKGGPFGVSLPDMPNPIDAIADLAGDVGSALLDKARNLAAKVLRPIINGAMDLIDAGLGPFGAMGKLGGGLARNMGESILAWVSGVDNPSKFEQDAPAPPAQAGSAIIRSGYQNLINFHRMLSMPGVVTSTYVGRTSGRHGQRKAVDFSVPFHGNKGYGNPGLAAIFNGFLAAQSSLYELILAGAPFNIKRGRRVPGYSWGRPGQRGNHWNHVHAATFDQGGILQPGWNTMFNATGGPETVVPLDMIFLRLEKLLRILVSESLDPVARLVRQQAHLDMARYSLAGAGLNGARQAQVTNNAGGNTIQVTAQTNADPREIADEILWVARTRLR